jgi:hypothetical protein
MFVPSPLDVERVRVRSEPKQIMRFTRLTLTSPLPSPLPLEAEREPLRASIGLVVWSGREAALIFI